MDIREKLNTIIKGDCIKVLKTMPNNSVDMIFADPPYFMQTDGELLRASGAKFDGVDDEWDKFDNFAEYDRFLIAWLSECRRVMKDTSSIWVIGSFQNIYRVGYIMQNLGFWILNDVVWSKPNAVPNFGGTRFQNSHETMLWCSKSKKSKYTFNYKTMKHLNGDKQEKSVWNISLCIGKERLKDEHGKKVHSTQKPENLLYNVILSSTKPNDIILDPFFGTGTTGSVAKRLGRNFIGIEREDKYIAAAQKRINETEQDFNDLYDLSLEVKPPRVSLKDIIAKGYIADGEKFYDKNGNYLCNATIDGYALDLATNEKLSIHKMSAKYLGKDNHNGWDYFYFKRDNSLTPINILRYEYFANENNHITKLV